MSIENDNRAPAQGEALLEKTERLLHEQLDLALRRGGQIPADTSEAIYNLACACRELSKDED